MTRTITNEEFQRIAEEVRQFESGYLRDLRTIIDGCLTSRKSQDLQNAKLEIQRIAKSVGISVEELMRNATPKDAKRTPARIKYQHPEDASLTWTGRGLAPKWFKQWQAEGKPLNVLLVPQ